MRVARTLASMGFIPVLLLSTACGGKGGGGGGTHTDPNTPIISDLRVSFGARCTLRSGLPGTIEVASVDFTDADGDVRGGTVEATGTAAVGGTVTVTGPIPSPGVSIGGSPTSGTITVTLCVHFGPNTSVTEQVRIADASGKVSNQLTSEVARPGGAPLLPSGADPTYRRSLEFTE